MRSRATIESDESASPNTVVTLKHHRKMFCIHPCLLIIQTKAGTIILNQVVPKEANFKD